MAKINNKRKNSLKSDKLLVQKSLPLFSLWNSDLTLAEFKILDAYLSKINSHKPENRVVVFDKSELEKELGVSKINQSALKPRLKNLMSNVVEISDVEEKRGVRLVTLFEEAVIDIDEYGVSVVRLECTQKAMKYFFNIENLGYLKYRLHCVVSLKSRYSYIMFIYLEHNKYRKSWEVSIADLKEILHCDDEETYKEYKFFNSLVLKKCHKELTEKTDLKYSYETVKRGRFVVAVKFTIEGDNALFQHDEPLQNPELPEELPNDLPVADVSTEQTSQESSQEFEYQNDTLEFLAEACGNEFNNKQMLVIFNIIATAKLEETGMGLEFDRYHFLSKRYSEMNYYSEKINILNRFSYFKRVVENSLKDNF